MANQSWHSDRVTEMFVAGNGADSFIAYEVTIENETRNADFSTWAWCPDQESADRIKKALVCLDALEEWTEYDEQGRTVYELIRELIA